MYEKRLNELSKKIGSDKKKRFYILPHKKHKREIYFRNSKEAIDFLKPKFIYGRHSYRKTIAYMLIKLKLLQPFLKKIKLSEKFGDVMFIAEKINCFDLRKKKILSFQLHKRKNKKFLNSKRFQKKASKKGFAPKVYKINEEIPYSEEEMCEEIKGERGYEIFKKLIEFYRFIGIERIPLKRYVSELKRELEKKEIKNNFLYEVLDSLSKKRIDLLITTLHGDFAKENTLLRKGEIVFTDWHPYKGLITNSISNYFRRTEDVLKEEEFKKIIPAYPKEVRENIKTYFILSEIDLIVKKDKEISKVISRIKRHFSHS